MKTIKSDLKYILNNIFNFKDKVNENDYMRLRWYFAVFGVSIYALMCFIFREELFYNLSDDYYNLSIKDAEIIDNNIAFKTCLIFGTCFLTINILSMSLEIRRLNERNKGKLIYLSHFFVSYVIYFSCLFIFYKQGILDNNYQWMFLMIIFFGNGAFGNGLRWKNEIKEDKV